VTDLHTLAANMKAAAAKISATANPNIRGYADAADAFADAVADKLEPVTPPPPQVGKLRFGIDANVAGYGTAAQNNVKALGAKLIREDRNDYALAWAKSQGITTIGIIWLNTNSVGMGADIIEDDNEPYYHNWNGLGFASYYQRCRDVAKTVKQLHPGKPVILPVLANTPAQCAQINAAAPDIWNYHDYIGVHPYTRPGPAANATPWLNGWRAELAKIGHGGIPFAVTEFGCPVSGTFEGYSAFTEEQQRLNLDEFFTLVEARSDVAIVMTYMMQDWGNRDSDVEHWFGLLRSDSSRRPGWDVVQKRIAAHP
jgi:hypothetical protein